MTHPLPSLTQDQISIRRRRLERELFWIARLRTAHPLGLNDRLQAMGISGNATDPNFTDFNYFRVDNLFSSKKRRRGGRRNRKKKGCVREEDFIAFRDELARRFISDRRQLESFILSKQGRFLSSFVASSLFQTLVQEIRYILSSRVDFIKKAPSLKQKTDTVIWKLDFTHKILEDIKIKAIFNMKEVRQLLPAQIRGKEVVRHVFSYGRTAGSKILNYNKALKEAESLTYNEMLELECECASSDLCDAHHGHISTGNLRIIDNDKLRQLCAYGTKFREIPRFKKDFVKDSFRDSVNNLISKLAKKFKIPKNSFKGWRDTFLEQFYKKLDYFATKQERDAPVLSDKKCKDELDRLQKRFVITMVDKAAGNYAFTCKKFYFLRLAQELGMQNEQPGNDIYEFQNKSEQEICDSLASSLKKFKAEPKNSEKKLALLYHTPKFHKNPIKYRFIAGNVKVVTSELDNIIAKILKMCKGHFSRLCKQYEEFSKVRYCFDIEKSADLKAGLDRFKGNAAIISVIDFSTLFAFFEHDHLISNMTWLSGSLSKYSGCHSTRVSHEGSFWTKGSSGIVYSIAEIIEMITFLIRNTYVKAFGRIFRQTKGVTMGGKSSGWLSDGSLMVDEFRYIDKKVKEGDIEHARSFKGLNRYRDDCTALNIDNFLEIARDIYPDSLELSQENDDLSKATVLDMDVSIVDGYFRTKVYNKTDSFPFEVVSLPFLNSNIDRQVCYKVFYSQVLRYERLCSFQCDFESRVRTLGIFLLKRGYRLALLRREFVKVIRSYRTEFERWSVPTDSKMWFSKIISNLPINAVTDSTPGPHDISFLSQPLPVSTENRFNFFSQ